MLTLFLDADGCPVKEEAYRVADRYQLQVFVVANKEMNIPYNERTKMIVVPGKLDAADDWIVENAVADDIVVTADILLADRCVKKQVRVLGPKGIEFTEDSVGGAVATRELMQHLRQTGESRGGPAPMERKDRSAFLGKLDQIVQNLRRKQTRAV
jgi:uncharacterized protein YaiI (UPF0178 family)